MQSLPATGKPHILLTNQILWGAAAQGAMQTSLLRAATRAAMAFRSPPELLLRNALRHGMSLHPNQTAAAASTYQAAVCEELGKPLQLKALPRRELDSSEVRVKVHSAAINFGDLLMVQGKYQEKPQLPFVPGTELSGEVIEAGSDTKFKPGDKVMSITTTLGGMGQEIIVNAMTAFKIPPGLDPSAAAALVCSYGTAYMGLKHKGHIKEGDTVLVTAAAGAVGLAAVDLAANVFKAKVIGACGSDEKCEIVKQKGAFSAINYKTHNVREEVKRLTEGRGADIAFDAVGGSITQDCIRSLAFEGCLIVIGFAGGEIPKIPANLLLVKSASVAGLYWGSYSFRSPAVFMESVSEVMKHAARGTIQPHIGKMFPLNEVNEAFQFVGQRKSTGKVIIRMS